MKRFSQILAILFLVFLLIGVPLARAETINVEVSGNGDNSDNQANVEVKTETVVQSTNTADVANNVEINSNTGGNTANDNTGSQTQIQTGDSATNLAVENNINSQNLDLTACGSCQHQPDLNVEVSGNGAGSQNSVNTQIGNSTNVTVENQATIQNNANVDANTGRNEASQNGGDVRISTGDISVDGGIKNRVNVSSVSIGPKSSNGDILIKNSQNGVNSVNDVNVKIENEINIEKLNFAVVDNDIDIQTNTGENVANDNLGDVEIDTGDISVIFGIINDPINADVVFVCKDPGGNPVVPPNPPEDVITPPVLVAADQVSSSSGSQSSTGGVLGINTLPNTGSSLLLLLAGWLLLLLLGRGLQVVAAKQEKKFKYLSASWQKSFRRVPLDK